MTWKELKEYAENAGINDNTFILCDDNYINLFASEFDKKENKLYLYFTEHK